MRIDETFFWLTAILILLVISFPKFFHLAWKVFYGALRWG